MRTAVLLLPLLALPSLLCAAETPPNIVLILSDDQAFSDYGFMGHPAIKTPHLDRLVSQGVVFRRGYVPTALCRPSLMTLVTGHYAHTHGVTGNDPSPRTTPPDSPQYNERRAALIAHIDRFETLPELLTERDYWSHQSGKWWEGNFRRGGFTHGMTRGFPQPGGRHGDDGLAIGRQGMKPVEEFIDRAVGEKKPFFLWYAPFLPHEPHTPPARILEKYLTPDRPRPVAKYFAMCEWFDETCGQLLGYLEQKGIRDNTLVVYIADNGWIQHPRSDRDHEPRSKYSPYEGGVRTPILYSWPKRIPPADRTELASGIDVVPTMLAAAGARIPADLPGLNLLPALAEGKPIERDTLFGEHFAHDVTDVAKPETSLHYRWTIEGRWKLILSYDGDEEGHPYALPNADKRPELYDLEADPWEKENRAAREPAIVSRLAEKIANWYPVTERKVQTQWSESP